MKKNIKICRFGFVLLASFCLFCLPMIVSVQAADTTSGGFEIITCGDGGPRDCDFEALKKTVGNLFKYLLELVILPVATIVLIWAGFMTIWESSYGRDSSRYRKALLNIVIGIALAVGAYALVRTFITLFFNDEGAFQEVIEEVFSGG